MSLPLELELIILSLLPKKLKRSLSRHYFHPMSECKLRKIDLPEYYIYPNSPYFSTMLITRNTISIVQCTTIMEEYHNKNASPGIIIISILVSLDFYRYHARNIKGLGSDIKTLKEIFQIAEKSGLLLTI